MNIAIVTVDAFTEHRFGGNPAGVVVTAAALSEEAQQALATEMNLAETAFVVVRGATDGELDAELRWFTPVAEVALCGHATLAAAHVLLHTAQADEALAGLGIDRAGLERVAFESRQSGTLTARRAGDGSARIVLDFPAEAAIGPVAEDVAAAAALALPEAVRGSIREVVYNRMDVMVVLDCAAFDSPAAFASMDVDLSAVAAVETQRGVVVTTSFWTPESDAETPHFVSRCFFPCLGVPEDPVTGSAHCFMGPYWAVKLNVGAGPRMAAIQMSKRVGHVGVRVTDAGRVELDGAAVAVGRYEVLEPIA
ncbi:phenazine biosynthesis protein PhzF family protein [Thecamonas trahens ATCC 50062]|uniref:Phenazine biosynthesis protein PhzF family protein n=1 Tax=Thecamonas trahens ATCC 50062 TaxID=461836 RepID=A0A0L0DHK2_THETB|nr:phenazine biosynthesis protein PhzF family protein [Thecamonas trahens ATCC 50062]KNC51576.1 phenazine biosynthesis protein PhzF family protein [Thecamonas trahens ATCC 50062]|eukprot:XP_013755978.1 phenazine biosynthesis protein PhzF family protein [Thecamonas trahens ATCC 50062]